MNAGRRFWWFYGGLILVGLFLGLQTHRAVESVLRAGNTGTATVRPEAEDDRILFEALARKDEVLVAKAEPVRDPFQVGASPAAWGGGDYRWSGRRTPPVLGGLLHDGRRPVVQLQAGRNQSGWLGVGDVYEGWTIDEITAHSVRLSRHGASVVLATS
jgi:hypothetical protein